MKKREGRAVAETIPDISCSGVTQSHLNSPHTRQNGPGTQGATCVTGTARPRKVRAGCESSPDGWYGLCTLWRRCGNRPVSTGFRPAAQWSLNHEDARGPARLTPSGPQIDRSENVSAGSERSILDQNGSGRGTLVGRHLGPSSSGRNTVVVLCGDSAVISRASFRFPPKPGGLLSGSPVLLGSGACGHSHSMRALHRPTFGCHGLDQRESCEHGPAIV